MIHLHCTKKLLARLPLDESGRLRSKDPLPWGDGGSSASALSGWHANLVLVQRRQCVLFVHDATRFPVFVPALKKADFAELEYWFVDGFMNTLLKCGADDALIDRAQWLLGPLVCDSDCDRSVQGTMNHMGQEVRIQFDYEGVSVAESTGYRASAWLADRPTAVKGVKDYIWPVEAMFGFIRSMET